MMNWKRFLVAAMAAVLGTAIMAVAQQPVPMAQSQAYTDPQVTQAGLLDPHPFGMLRCETCDDYVCKCECTPKKKVVYSSNCKPFCLPKFGACSGECPDCGEIAFRKILVKKHKTLCDETVIKCVPTPVCPPCPAPEKK